jgi:hypothetical protein
VCVCVCVCSVKLFIRFYNFSVLLYFVFPVNTDSALFSMVSLRDGRYV